MIVRWDDLSSDEKGTLERLFAHNSLPVLPLIADHLISQGLAKRTLGGVSISLAGEDLVVQHSGPKVNSSKRADIRAALKTAGVTLTNGDEPGVKLKRQPE